MADLGSNITLEDPTQPSGIESNRTFLGCQYAGLDVHLQKPSMAETELFCKCKLFLLNCVGQGALDTP